MALGIFLAVLGAILTFAVRQGDSPTVDLNVVGLILMVAGAAVMSVRTARQHPGTRRHHDRRQLGPEPPDAHRHRELERPRLRDRSRGPKA